MLSPNQIEKANAELAQKLHQSNDMKMLAQYCVMFEESLKEAMSESDVSLMTIYKLQQEFLDGVFRFAGVERTLSN